MTQAVFPALAACEGLWRKNKKHTNIISIKAQTGAAACLAESDGRLVAYQSSINLLATAGDEDGYHSEAEAMRLLPDKEGHLSL